MPEQDSLALRGLDEEVALRTILEGTATETGERFFDALVENLAKALHTYGAFVTEYFRETRRMKALAFWMDGGWVKDWEMDVAGTPCEAVYDSKQLVHFPDNLLDMYPNDPDVAAVQAVSYLGMPLIDLDGTILGHLAVMDTRPMPEEPRIHAIFKIFAARAAAELRRLRAESSVREREEKLGRLVDSAMDAIIELDQELQVTRINPAAEKVFQCPTNQVIGHDFKRFLPAKDQNHLLTLIEELHSRPEGERYLWIPGGLTALRANGEQFPAEATLSRFDIQRQTFHTLILRNVNERLEAEQKIRSLTVETQYLKEELHELQRFDDIIGQSAPMLRVLSDIQQVARTDATVLITGETGTGKEVIARAIHSASQRADQPFVKVNCAAIPATLIESEFFGHEQGAFTGATKKRDGRFALANHGTIFLDEIGELPLDLQSKLLRVLQEGEFEPIGSSKTQKVDIRVLAATNRDLKQAINEGTFREDLYYRINVFPIHVPPLRDRGDDIVRLATAFVDRFAHRMGRTVASLAKTDLERLRSYNWPGNVRELQNVIERAVITAQSGELNLDRALPESTGSSHSISQSAKGEDNYRVRTVKELEELERVNLIRALESTNWRVSGDNGAAKLLGMKQSTLASRIKALGISRPPSK